MDIHKQYYIYVFGQGEKVLWPSCLKLSYAFNFADFQKIELTHTSDVGAKKSTGYVTVQFISLF